MTTIQKTIEKIDPEATYNLSNIKDNNLFPWAKDIRTIRKFVVSDKTKILKAKITGAGRALDYKIKGKNIIEFLEKYGEVLKSIKRN